MTTSPSEAVARLRETVAKYQNAQGWRQTIAAESGLGDDGLTISTNQQLEDTAVLLSLLEEARRVVEPFAASAAALEAELIRDDVVYAGDPNECAFGSVSLGDLRAAAAFLEKLGSET